MDAKSNLKKSSRGQARPGTSSYVSSQSSDQEAARRKLLKTYSTDQLHRFGGRSKGRSSSRGMPNIQDGVRSRRKGEKSGSKNESGNADDGLSIPRWESVTKQSASARESQHSESQSSIRAWRDGGATTIVSSKSQPSLSTQQRGSRLPGMI